MKNFLGLAFVFLFTLLTLQFASANLQILNLTSQTVNHGSSVSIPFTLNNTDGEVTNITMTITNLSNLSQTLNVPVADSKKTIAANTTSSYVISGYSIQQYQAPGIYSLALKVTGSNEIGQNISVTKSFDITVSQDISISVPELSVTTNRGRNPTPSFTIKNTGNVNLTDLTFTLLTAIHDSDNRTINVSFPSSISLAKGESRTVTFNIKVPENIEVKSYTGTVGISANAGSATLDKNVTLTINLESNFCEEGIIGGDLSIEIRDPDGGDDFYPSDIIDISVRVRNYDSTDHDVTVVADLFDVTDGEFLDIESEESVTIADNDQETVDLSLEVPSDVNEEHTYRIYVKAYEDGAEDEQCESDYVGIDIKKNTHDVSIDKIKIPDEVSCDSNFDLSLRVSNTGKKDEDVRIRVTNKELGISEEKTLSIDTEDTKDVKLNINTPKNADEKNYTLNIELEYYLSGDEYRESKTESAVLHLEGACVPASSISLSTELVNKPSEQEKFSVKVTLFNTGDKTTTYKLIVTGYSDWASLEKIEPVEVTVDKDSTGSAYIYLTPNKGVTGERSLTVKALYDGKTAQQNVDVAVSPKVTAKGLYSKVVDKLSNLSGLNLTTVNIVLIIAIVLLILWILRARR
ncbi:putative S-layer protein [Candidatus Pacearchaeota archaeon]|nr:putative S-layer protein [Candidatus Pacearchaeota archaeon]